MSIADSSLHALDEGTLAPERDPGRGRLAAALRSRRLTISSDRRLRRRGLRTARGRGRGFALFLAGFVLAAALLGGFLRFTEEVDAFSHHPLVGKADGIVVLTGGALRIDQAIELLKEGHGRRLLISGVNPGTSARTLAHLTGTERRWFDCCVDLDYAALNTVGNAEMAAAWARRKGFDSLILVTSDYHMPRSLSEFARMDSLASITPYAVRRTDLWRSHDIPTSAGLKILLTEYVKFVAAKLRSAIGFEAEPSIIAAYAHRYESGPA